MKLNVALKVGLLTKIVKGGAPLDPRIFDDSKIANLTHSSAAFKVDQILDVSRRTEACVNEPVGTALPGMSLPRR